MLLDLIACAADLGDLDDVGVFCSVIALSADYELALRIVDINLGVVAEHAGRVEVVEVLSVLLTVGELIFYFLKGGFFTSREKRRQLARALAADISVLKLSVAEKSDLLAANIAVFLFKKSHL